MTQNTHLGIVTQSGKLDDKYKYKWELEFNGIFLGASHYPFCG